MHSAAKTMRLYMTIWLYKSVYLKRKHERDVFSNVCDKKENLTKKKLWKELFKKSLTMLYRAS